jgi:hypothetical protein
MEYDSINIHFNDARVKRERSHGKVVLTNHPPARTSLSAMSKRIYDVSIHPVNIDFGMNDCPVVVGCPSMVPVRGADIVSQSRRDHEIIRANASNCSGPQCLCSAGWTLQGKFMVIRSSLHQIQTILVDGTSVRQDDARKVYYLLELSIYVEFLEVAATIIPGELRHE